MTCRSAILVRSMIYCALVGISQRVRAGVHRHGVRLSVGRMARAKCWAPLARRDSCGAAPSSVPRSPNHHEDTQRRYDNFTTKELYRPVLMSVLQFFM
ncbi:hypothetical protein V1523DRAFT_140274 [Lipomyces doorenjongii]